MGVMQIIEHMPTRLVLCKRTPLLAAMIALFTVISFAGLVFVPAQGIVNVIARGAPDMPTRVLSLLGFLALGTCFVITGTLAAISAGRGVRCVFDKEAEIVTVRKTRLLWMHTTTHPIYGVSHLELASNHENSMVGLFLVLRSGQRIALCAEPASEGERLEALVRAVRQFLKG